MQPAAGDLCIGIRHGIADVAVYQTPLALVLRMMLFDVGLMAGKRPLDAEECRDQQQYNGLQTPGFSRGQDHVRLLHHPFRHNKQTDTDTAARARYS